MLHLLHLLHLFFLIFFLASPCTSMSTNAATPTTPPSTTTYYNYFAFGSNMCSSTMTALRSLNPVAASAAILPNHSLRFNVPGTALIEPSWASVEPVGAGGVVPQTSISTVNSNDQPSHVHGVLYKLTEEDFLRVCNTEGIPFAYTLHRCRVVPYNGDGEKAGYDALLDQSVTPATTSDPSNGRGAGEMALTKSLFAYTLRASRKEWRQGNDIPPSRAYLNVLIRGAHEFQLDDEYLQYLKGIVPGNTIGDGMAEMMLEGAERRAAAV